MSFSASRELISLLILYSHCCCSGHSAQRGFLAVQTAAPKSSKPKFHGPTCCLGATLSAADQSSGDSLRDSFAARTLSEEILIKMSFTYWIVYCISVFGLKLHIPEESWLLHSLKLTTVLSYLLTASSILSLPLQRMAVRRVED